MRLEREEVACILAAVRASDATARVYLFGSRTDNGKQGGDIDLLVLSENLSSSDETRIDVAIQEKLGEQKIDVLVRGPDAVKRDPFIAHIFKSAVELV